MQKFYFVAFQAFCQLCVGLISDFSYQTSTNVGKIEMYSNTPFGMHQSWNFHGYINCMNNHFDNNNHDNKHVLLFFNFPRGIYVDIDELKVGMIYCHLLYSD